MPVVERIAAEPGGERGSGRNGPRDGERGREGGGAARGAVALLAPRCGNPGCAMGWMRLWRSARSPRFEGQWACSPGCMRAMVAAVVRRERGREVPAAYPHRVPIGLMLLEQGEISEANLRMALAECRRQEEETGEAVRLGAWLVGSGLLTEAALTRGLSAQWGCPAFSLANFRAEETAAVLPRLLGEAYGGVPVRASGGRGICLIFAGAVDRSLSYAVGRMTGLRVTAGVAGDREWKQAQEEYGKMPGPRVEFLEAADAGGLAGAMAGRIEKGKAAEALLVRVHEFWWLRLWRRGTGEPGLDGCGEVEDLVGTLRGSGPGY